MSNTGVRKTDVWKAEGWKSWEGRLVDGKFTLRRLLGDSDHSAVFLTERQSSQKAVIKLVAFDAKDADAQFSRWRAAAQLSHPRLLRVFEFGRCQMDGTLYLYLLMECADEDLSQILPHRALTPGEAAELLPPLLEALSYLHSKKLVHGRLKPSNVMAVGDQLKLSTDYITPVTEMNSAVSRRDVYDAPEASAGIVSPAGDMWSLGVTLVAALTQNVPFSGELSQRDPVAPEKMPEPFSGIVRECLHLDPKRRCTVADVQARLQPAARVVPAEPAPVPTTEPRMNRGPIIAVVLAVAVVLGVVGLYMRGKSPTSPPAPDQSTQQASPQAAEPATPQTSQPPVSQTPQQAAPPATSQTTSTPRQKTSASASSSAGNGIVRQVIPEVPRSARNTISGRIRVVVRVEVDASGKVTNATFVSPGPSKYFSGLALKAAREWEFSPLVNGQAAAAWTLTFHFGRSNTQVTPQRSKR